MTIFIKYFLVCFALVGNCASNSDDQQLRKVMDYFETNSSGLQIPGPTLSYENMLENIGSEELLIKQKDFFQKIQLGLSKIKPSKLSKELNIEFWILKYESELHLERIELAFTFLKDQPAIHDKGIYHIKNGKAWYSFLVKSWTSGSLNPEEIVKYGYQEIAKIKGEMKNIEESNTNFFEELHSEKFLSNDNEEIQNECMKAKELVAEKLVKYFPDFNELPKLKIEKTNNPEMAKVPGFYNNNTFYYTLFDKPFDKRKIDWLFIHEGNPGHHFQINYESTLSIPNYRNGISYSGFREGWAAYVENMGHELGLYQTPFHYYSKWEWDIIRSVRLVLDVGINYYGWTDEESLREWQKHIQNRDDIGLREIRRMRRWPAQVLSYKVGERAIQKIRSKLEQEQGADFDLKFFHTILLSQRSIPVQLIDKLFS